MHIPDLHPGPAPGYWASNKKNKVQLRTAGIAVVEWKLSQSAKMRRGDRQIRGIEAEATVVGQYLKWYQVI